MALSGYPMVGVAVRIQPPVTGGEQIKLDVVFRDCQSVPATPGYPEMGTFLSVDKATVEEWIKTKARILTFHGGRWINLDDPKEKLLDADLNPIKSVDELIRRMRKHYREHPEIETVRSCYRPFSAEECRRLGVEPNSRLAVPCDKKVERWALSCLRDKDWTRRIAGIDGLYYFESPANIKTLKGLRADPYSIKQSDGELDYPVRRRALDMLSKWGAKLDR